MSDETLTHAPRGFAGMDASKQREIASKGGRVAHEKRTAHEFSSDEARRAGHLGGLSVSRDRAHMATIGRQGGKARRVRGIDMPVGALSESNNLAGSNAQMSAD